jgi:hypothetical protein
MHETTSVGTTPREVETPDGRRWLPLLRRLAEVADDGGVWKNADDALKGTGDVDFTAPTQRWPAIVEEYRRWAMEIAVRPVIVCRHVPFTLLMVGMDGSRPELLQLDVRDRVTFRGSTVARARQLVDLMETDDRGFRRLRPGAEGLLKLVHKGLGAGGRAKWERLRRERVVELIRSDPIGSERAADLLGAPGLLRGATALIQGRWDRSAMIASELLFAARAILEPSTVLRRLLYRLTEADRCPVVRATTRYGRRIQGPPDRWIDLAQRYHPQESR